MLFKGSMSYRVRVPLAITAVILMTEVVVSIALVTRAFSDARHDLEASASNLSSVLARSLREPMIRDDVWSAFEVVRTPVAIKNDQNLLESVVVLDVNRRVYVSSDPRTYPTTSVVTELPAELQSSLKNVTAAIDGGQPSPAKRQQAGASTTR